MHDLSFDPALSPEIQHMARSLLGGDAFDILPKAPLSGGFNNTNLVIEGDGQKWVLKIRPDNHAIFGADPMSSIQVQSYAASLGLAGDVVAVDTTGLHFATTFLQAQTVRPDIARAQQLLPQVVGVLHRLHPGPCSCATRSFFDDIRLFMTGVRDNNIALPDGFQQMLDAAFEIEEALHSARPPTGVCHNDLVPQNFILNEGDLKLVDFDYAGIGLIAAEL